MIEGILKVPGDKSITHRALIFSALVDGEVIIENISTASDCVNTADCMQSLGLAIVKTDKGYTVRGEGLKSLKEPEHCLDAGNSGTTIRILSGLLSGLPFDCRIDGDQSIRRRPMARIIEPLSQMGARIRAVDDRFAPLDIMGSKLKGQNFDLKVPSAQVQTCLLLAGLLAQGCTTVTTPLMVRDHSSRMLKHMGVEIEEKASGAGSQITVNGLSDALASTALVVPSDLSSAAFFIVASVLLDKSDLLLTGVGLNPGRTMILDVLVKMGASIDILNRHEVSNEPVCDIRVKGGKRLKSIEIGPYLLPSGIDEIPILALCASLCDGEMVVSGAEELRYKESDRLFLLVTNLRRNGVEVVEAEDGFRITGQKSVKGGQLWESGGDHRMAMTGAIASLVFDSPVKVDDLACIDVSYPEFFHDLESVSS